MKFKFLLFFLLFFALLFTTLHAQNSRPDLNRVRTYDVQHYIIRVSFDRNAKRIFGDTTVQLKPLAANFKQVELDSEDMVYDSVKLETTGADL